MWLNLTKEQVSFIRDRLNLIGPKAECQKFASALAGELDDKLRDGFAECNQAWVEKAKELHQNDGEVEVDEQCDNSAIISYGDEGAYVMAWVYVRNEDMGITDDEDEDDDA